MNEPKVFRTTSYHGHIVSLSVKGDNAIVDVSVASSKTFNANTLHIHIPLKDAFDIDNVKRLVQEEVETTPRIWRTQGHELAEKLIGKDFYFKVDDEEEEKQ